MPSSFAGALTVEPLSRDRLLSDLRRLGVRAGDHLMVHASLRAIGPVVGGADGVLDALEAAVGGSGTLLMVLGAGDVPEWNSPRESAAAADPEGRSTPFNPFRSPADPDVGWLAEVFRRRAGTHVTDHPLGRFGARGALADRLLKDQPWHDYYGPGSPLERLCTAGGRVLRLGADLGTVTLLHWAEYLAPLPWKRSVRRYVAVEERGAAVIRYVDSLDDSKGIVVWDGDDYFELLLTDYLATGRASVGQVGGARSELLESGDLVSFAVDWMMEKLGPIAAKRAMPVVPPG